jgi:WhiB family redox-sensing transcriptional regulator
MVVGEMNDYDDITLDIESWREAAACLDMTEVAFFPSPDDLGAISRAKAICAGCPVADDCLAFAIETRQPDGIWGGMTPKERARVRRRWLEEIRRAS